MSTIDALHRSEVRSSVLVVRTGIVGLALATAAIHASLGGMIFTLNAIGYTTLAMAMVLPGPFGRYRWLIRLALAGFTAATIGGWVLFGARFPGSGHAWLEALTTARGMPAQRAMLWVSVLGDRLYPARLG